MRGRPQRLAVQRAAAARAAAEAERASTSKKPSGPQRAVGHRAKKAYLREDDQHYHSFREQLQPLGLQLRDIPGDGNCLFRALADQECGDHRQHAEYRTRIVQFMKDNEETFAPFVVDETFEEYIARLSEDGEYGDQDCIVAYATISNCIILVHQINSPVWAIYPRDGTNVPADRPLPTRQLHISYHNGEHYSSVRRIDDNEIRNRTQPANVRIESPMLDAHNAEMVHGFDVNERKIFLQAMREREPLPPSPRETTPEQQSSETKVLSRKQKRRVQKQTAKNRKAQIEREQKAFEERRAAEETVAEDAATSDDVSEVEIVRRNLAKHIFGELVLNKCEQAASIEGIMEMLSQHNDDKESVMAQLLEGDGITSPVTEQRPEGVEENESNKTSSCALPTIPESITMKSTEVVLTESLQQTCSAESDRSLKRCASDCQMNETTADAKSTPRPSSHGNQAKKASSGASIRLSNRERKQKARAEKQQRKEKRRSELEAMESSQQVPTTPLAVMHV